MPFYPSRSRRRTSGQHLVSPSRATSENQSHVQSLFYKIPEDPIGLPFTFDATIRRMRRRLRLRFAALVLVVLSFVAITTVLRRPVATAVPRPRETSSTAPPQADHEVPTYPSTSHPMWSLITNAQREFEELQSRQSKSLSDAVSEYRRRYGIPPPPNFDKWYNFAKENGVQLIDEYDTIHHTLTPFWGLKPATIRARAREALGYDNNLLGFLIRHGNVTKVDGGKDWMQEALRGMTEKFVHYLPDMDLCFNVHDEPRVVLQHDDLSRLVALANDVVMPAANRVIKPRNEWSWRPADMNDGSRINEFRRTRFNRMNYQASWTHSRLSCPPSSAARSLDEDAGDDLSSYAVGPLGFVSNHTAFSDICNSPSFRNTYGFFAAPNSFSVVQDLFPIFSQSKISTFQDINYPSPWYWYGKVPYDEEQDMDWRTKESTMYWRGSTTGGYSRDGGWRQQHRQRFVSKVNAGDHAKILQSTSGDASSQNWTTKDVIRSEFADIFDVKFSEIGQCDRGDCLAQTEFFGVEPKAAQEDAWKYKYLLDIDGNAFSGRFYAFLKSKSLVYKLAVFREWHAEFVRPWVHYIPLSLRGEEWIESVRWFAGVEEGRQEAERVALAGRDWADKVLRNEDMEAWFFRLLLEYGRLVDDDRDIIGFSV